jgi:hypothetical protein
VLAYRGSPTVSPPWPRWAEQARGLSYSRGASAVGRSRAHRWSLTALVVGPRDTMMVLVRGERPARWEPQEEGVMSIAASFPSVKKPRYVDLGEKGQTTEGDAC